MTLAPNAFPSAGTRIILKGKTLKGKNRIRRGGNVWLVTTAYMQSLMFCVESVEKGNREMFWIEHPYDQHVEVVHDSP